MWLHVYAEHLQMDLICTALLPGTQMLQNNIWDVLSKQALIKQLSAPLSRLSSYPLKSVIEYDCKLPVPEVSI